MLSRPFAVHLRSPFLTQVPAAHTGGCTVRPQPARPAFAPLARKFPSGFQPLSTSAVSSATTSWHAGSVARSRLARILFQVKQLRRQTVIVDELPRSASNHALEGASTEKGPLYAGRVVAEFGKGHVVPRRRLAAQQRQQAASARSRQSRQSSASSIVAFKSRK